MAAVDFIGIGAQKAGTSWVYACLYEHPEICAPVKEIHFFSRERFQKGIEWYEQHWRNCSSNIKTGEFSTSYLYSEEAAKRIHTHYPHVKLIAILRNPVTRAYSQYQNALKAGEISASVTFDEYSHNTTSVIEQGLYNQQLERYRALFPAEQLLTLVYEDIQADPAAFIRSIYSFLEVDPNFTPSMLHRQVNVARRPRFVWVERLMHVIAETLRRIGFDRLVWVVKKSGVTDVLRSANTSAIKESHMNDHSALAKEFASDAALLGQHLHRDLKQEWKL